MLGAEMWREHTLMPLAGSVDALFARGYSQRRVNTCEVSSIIYARRSRMPLNNNIQLNPDDICGRCEESDAPIRAGRSAKKYQMSPR